MRDYGVILPSFWTGDTGRKIRALGAQAQLIGAYLLTAPGSNMIGLYYLPLPTLAHEANTPEDMALLLLEHLNGLGFAAYDRKSETVWVRNMGFYQVGEKIQQKDKRWPAILKEATNYSGSPHFEGWLSVYGAPWNLDEAFLAGAVLESPSKGVQRAIRKRKQSPLKGVPSMDEPEQEDPLKAFTPTGNQDSENQEAPSKGVAEDGKPGSEPPSMPRARARARAEAGAGTRAEAEASTGASEPPAPAPRPRDAAAAAALPPFLEKRLKELGVSGQYPQQLLEKLGRVGLQCAVYKISTKPGGRNPPGLLLTHGSELASEGKALLEEAVAVAGKGAPGAWTDPRWGKLPPELRDDLEAQTAWADWIRVERQWAAARGGAGEEEAGLTEKGARRTLLKILQDHHPDPSALGQDVQKRMAAMPAALQAPVAKFMALTAALGLGGKA
ncbi:hypothetical protein [Geothrix sp. 21YS21S-2]|uniref:hypothetical protein n=1 Tax=Geothrix sp. 21YS21S-2 TaxID=3068893 RepID=UPI0027B9EC4D|nr:hypothetical protein [Geothrix sp. 21YS21S-2]